MHRFGLAPDQVDDFLLHLSHCPNLYVEGLMSHLATADAPTLKMVQQQLDAFAWVQQRFAVHGLTPSYVHIANSAGLCRYPASHGTLVRPGILLYGS
jgi:alanine racemase